MLIRFNPFVVFDGEETAGGAATPEAVEPAVTPPAATQPGPWASDLDTYFGDDSEAKAAADRYMREMIQPRMTQLETESAPARELYKDLIASPQETLAEVFSELYEDQPELVAKFASIWGDDEPEVEAAAATPPPAEDEPEWAKSARLREEAQRDADAVKAGEEAYHEVLAELREAHEELTDDDMELIHPFMASAPDPESAYAGYKAWEAKFAAKNGGVTPAEAAAEAVTAPPVLGSEAAVAATPPVARAYKDFDDAWDAWRAEEAVAAPPVVGSA